MICTAETKSNPNPNTTVYPNPTKPSHMTVYGVHGNRKSRYGAKLQESHSLDLIVNKHGSHTSWKVVDFYF